MIDIDALETLVKTVTSGAAAQKSADPVIRNMGRLEFDDACKQYLRATNPAAILALIAEVRALREDAERYRWAIAYEDNAEMLLAAVMNNAPDKKAISAEIDAERAKEKA
jgi:hypothetical protein